MNVFLEYPKCSTCKEVKKYLRKCDIAFVERNIKEENPTYDELKSWIDKSNKPIKSFFNTSGLVYKELGLKEKMSTMSDEEKILLLSTNGMLVKRPLFVTDDAVYVGKKEIEKKDWQ